MPVNLNADELQRRVASGKGRYVFHQQPKPKPPAVQPPPPPPAADPGLAAAVQQVATALATGQQEQRELILRSLAVTEQLVTALGEIGRPEPLSPWRATVVSRDRLGRIQEVDFNPR